MKKEFKINLDYPQIKKLLIKYISLIKRDIFAVADGV